jgi:hypothetical protein
MLVPIPFEEPEAFVSTEVQLKVVPETLLPSGISVIEPVQIEFDTGVAVTTGIGLTVTIVEEVKGATPTVEGVAVQT